MLHLALAGLVFASELRMVSYVALQAWNIETAAEYNLNGPVGQVYAMAVAFDVLFAGTQVTGEIFFCLIF